MSAIATLIPFLCTLLAADAIPRAQVGAYLQAGHRVQQDLQGRVATARASFPATSAGLRVRVAADTTEDAKRTRKLIRTCGVALKPTDRAAITKVVVAAKRIEVWLGAGGYRGGGEPLVQGSPGCLEQDVVWTADGPIRDTDAMHRNTEALQNAARSAENAREERIRQAASKAGSRIVFEFHDPIPLALLTPESVRRLLAPYVSVPAEER